MDDEFRVLRDDINRWVNSGIKLFNALESIDDGSPEINDLQDVIINGLGGIIYRGDDAS